MAREAQRLAAAAPGFLYAIGAWGYPAALARRALRAAGQDVRFVMACPARSAGGGPRRRGRAGPVAQGRGWGAAGLFWGRRGIARHERAACLEADVVLVDDDDVAQAVRAAVGPDVVLRRLSGGPGAARRGRAAAAGCLEPGAEEAVLREVLRPTPDLREQIVSLGLFDSDYYVQTNTDVVSAGIDPLEHYVVHGPAEGRWPHPLLDPEHVAAQLGTDPREHVLPDYAAADHVIAPHPSFDPAFYAAQVPGVAAPLAHFAAVGVHLGLQAHPNADSALDATDTVLGPPRPDALPRVQPVQALRSARTFAAQRSSVLMIETGAGGGVARHRAELAARLGERENVSELVLGPDRARLARGPVATTPERVIVQHVLDPDAVVAELDRVGMPYELILHDYALFAAHPWLAGPDGRCIQDPVAPDGAGARLLDEAQRVVVFSADQAGRLRAAGVERELIVEAPHGALVSSMHVEPRACRPDDEITVLLLGELGAAKGLALVTECVRAAERDGLPLRFRLLGTISGRHEPWLGEHLEPVGPYREQDAQSLIRQFHPHVVWLPSQVPETFSYPLSHALELGLPVVASDFGAFGERLARRPWSWQEQWHAAPERWLELLLAVRRLCVDRRYTADTPPAPRPF